MLLKKRVMSILSSSGAAEPFKRQITKNQSWAMKNGCQFLAIMNMIQFFLSLKGGFLKSLYRMIFYPDLIKAFASSTTFQEFRAICRRKECICVWQVRKTSPIMFMACPRIHFILRIHPCLRNSDMDIWALMQSQCHTMNKNITCSINWIWYW